MPSRPRSRASFSLEETAQEEMKSSVRSHVPFIACCTPAGLYGPTCISWAGLTRSQFIAQGPTPPSLAALRPDRSGPARRRRRAALPGEGGAALRERRRTPCRPRSWANSSLLSLRSNRNARASLRLLGQPGALLARPGPVVHQAPGGPDLAGAPGQPQGAPLTGSAQHDLYRLAPQCLTASPYWSLNGGPKSTAQ